MLRDLHVENLAVISQASIQLEPGFNVLTGETGAGKSMFVDALALLSGVRASTDLIRTGANDLTVTGIFEPGGDRWRSNLDVAGIETEGDEIVVRREISREGRNRVFLNDRPVSLALLTSISGSLIRIHTQREELDLVSPEVQRSWLDRVGGVDGSSLHDKVGSLFEIYQHLEARLQRTQDDDRARAERADLLRFQIEEIDAAELRESEDIDLEQERDSLRHAEAIHEALGAVFTRIFENEGSAIEQISLSTRELRKIEAWESQAPKWIERLTQVQVQLEDLTGEVRSRVDAVAADPNRLDVVEERLAMIDRLRRKYGDSVRGVLDYRARIETELEEVVTDVQQKERLAERVEEAFEE